MNARNLRIGLFGSLAATSAVLAGCSGGGGGSSSGTFDLTAISIPEGAVWEINKRIELTFSDEVDLLSVIAGSTLQLKSTDGSGSPAFYEVGYKTDLDSGSVDKTTLVIQPFCPLLGDLSDAGLAPGGVDYQLYIPGKESSASTIRSVNGAKVSLSQERNFMTPTSVIPAAVFDDTEIGPAAFVPELSFVRLGDGSEIPFVDSGPQYDLPTILPLNLYSDPDSRVEFLVQLNQAVDPSEGNLNDDRVRIEYKDGGGVWQAFDTNVELEANCALEAPGAILRLTPVGILPQDTELRVTIVAGFSDLVGEQNQSNQTNFFADTSAIDFASLTPSDGGADEYLEDFLVGGAGSFEDFNAKSGAPNAVWSDGMLTAAFDFEGTGGPGGEFDWHSPIGPFNFSTDFQPITGGPDGIPTETIQVVNGRVDVNDLVITGGSYVRVLPGDNPLTIFATGDVIIEGILDCSGFSAKPVGTLFTPNQPELGAVGPAGGGTGGTGSFLTSASTPSGGVGDGPFGLKNAGGNGGEAGHSASADKQQRRGAGGGGGRFGPDVTGLSSIPIDYALIATQGGTGHPSGKGGITGESPAIGGLPGAGPFLDGDDTNDFFGQAGVFDAGNLVDVITGELGLLWAGYGGGAGGDAVQSATFPTVPFGPPYKDKKGCGGAGGGGQLRIVALGKIIFRPGGRILVNGGVGNTGENVLGFDHIAGSSGGGSGGHVVLESATQIDFTNGGINHVPEQYVQAYGGDGGISYTTSLSWSGGGDGSPGIVQLHVPDANPATAIGSDVNSFPIVVPLASSLSDVTRPPANVLIPTFGARSKARSIWVPLGGASVVPGGGLDPVFFTFGGTDTTGKVATTSEIVDPLGSILGPETLGTVAPAPVVDVDGFTLVLSQASIQPLIDDLSTPSLDMYLRNPSLLTNFQLRLSSLSSAKNFDVASATFDDATTTLRVTTNAAGSSLESFVTDEGGPSNVDFELIPRFFRTQTGLIKDMVPDTGYVQVLFQATGAGVDGSPDEDNPVVDWTADITDFNTVPAGDIEYFRWEVEFNLDDAGAGLTVNTIPIAIDFLRTTFGF